MDDFLLRVGFEVLKGFNKKEDKERQIRPILARQVWIDESAAQVVPCGRDLTLAVAFVEKKLTKRERKDFQTHLLDCRHCRQFVSSEVRLQRPVFESPVAVAVSRGSFFSQLRFQWVAAAAALVLTAGVTSLFFVNHDAKIGQASIPRNDTVSGPAVAGAVNPGTQIVDSVQRSQRGIVAAVALNGSAATDSLRTSIDLGGLAGAASSSASGTVTNPSAVTPVSDSVAKRDLPENLFNVDGSTVNPVASTVTGMIQPPPPAADEKVFPSSEYRVRVESTNIDARTVAAPNPTTELKTELISMSLSDLDQAAINVPAGGNGFVRRDSEIVIMSRPLVPWTTSVNHPPNSSGAENSISKRSPYSNQARGSFAGKLFNQVDKVWIDQEFTASPNLPVVKVKVKSPEGQQLLATNPGLKPFFTMHRQIVVVFEGKVYMTY